MLRNKELRRFAVLYAAVSAAFAAAGFAVSRETGALLLGLAAALGAACFLMTRARYKRIGEMSEQIDRVLHDADAVYISESEEGELSILQSEITKMTVRIREQNDALKRERGYLADSLADIAHQLRTPLTSANLVLSLLEGEGDEGRRKALLRETEELLAQTEWLIGALLKLSRLDAGIVTLQNERIDVRALIDSVLRPLLIPMELHDVSAEIGVPEGACISGDALWLAEAVRNIVKNCMESAGDGGRIRIECEDTVLFTQFTLRDNGAGFAAEDLPHVFDRFYRGKKDGASGYGIGLALCKMIVVRHGGTITAKNHPHGGAVFTLRFPK